MTIFLRTDKNQTILDLDVWVKTEDANSFVEISSNIDIFNYSYFLLKEHDKKKQMQIIHDFDRLSELRGWLWEIYFQGRQNREEEYESIVEELKHFLYEIANKYDLCLIID